MAVYDCFTFFNELDLLEVRLRILNPYVDKFVLVELPKTFRGKTKELVFKNNRERFREYIEKIIYICPQKVPEYEGDGSFNIEFFQRNNIIIGLLNCKNDDIIMISDVDEIPNPQLFSACFELQYKKKQRSVLGDMKPLFFELSLGHKQLVKKIIKNQSMTLNDWLDETPLSLRQDLFYYYMNCKSKGDWYGTVLCKYKHMNLPQELRNNRELYPYIQEGGWHFSYLGGVDKVKEKLRSIVDGKAEIVKKLNSYSADDDYITDCLKNGRDILGRKGTQFEYKFIDSGSIGLPGVQDLVERYPNFFGEYGLEDKAQA